MDNLDHIIKQLQACTQELAEDNDKAEERERLQRFMLINERTYRNYPRVVRNYDSDTMVVYCGDGRMV